ncbi:MAG: MoaD/ThiS family protein [Firmicutes bacterium]|nr:MoaD/ThiS family protein [Bacillota bacterium]
MNVRVRFFPPYQDLAGKTQEILTFGEGTTVKDLLINLEVAYPDLRGMSAGLGDGHTVWVSRSGRTLGPADILHDGDEIVLLAPVMGG